MKALFVLRNSKGEFYSFAGGQEYDGPQLSKDPRDAKRMTAQGAGSVKRLLANRAYWGDEFERIPAEQITTQEQPHVEK